MQNPAPRTPLKVLLTGAGSIGRRHAQNVRALVPDAVVSCVCRSANSSAWASDFGALQFPSVEAALDMGVDLAVICSASSSHAGDLQRLLACANALYIEKPLVTTPEALEAVQGALDAGWDRPSVVGCNLRYLGAIEKLKAALDRQAAGRCAHAGLRVGQWLPDWRPHRDWRSGYSAHRSQGGGVIFDLVHEVDMAVYLFGEIRHGQAAAASLSSLGLDADDSAAITLSMQSGLPVQVTLDYVSRRPQREYELTCDNGSLRLDVMAKTLEIVDGNGRETIPTTLADWDIGQTYGAALSDLLAAMKTGAPTRYALRDAIHTTRWMLQLERTAWRASVRCAEDAK